MWFDQHTALNLGAHAGHTKSYICFSICKALQSLIFWVLPSRRSYKVIVLLEK